MSPSDGSEIQARKLGNTAQVKDKSSGDSIVPYHYAEFNKSTLEILAIC